MPTVNLTDLMIRSLRPIPGKRVTYLDKTLKGFGVRITENGAKTFVLTYGPDRRRVKLGDVGVTQLKAARDKAKTILAEHQLAVPSDARAEFDDALATFLRHYAEKNRPVTVYETTRLLRRHLEPALTGKPLTYATRRTLVDILDGIESVSIRRHFYTAAYTFFRWARRYDLRNPLEGIEKPPKSKPRERLIRDDEFLKIWDASLTLGTYGLLVRCLLVSGQRLRQITYLSGAYIDRTARTITWPRGLMKNDLEFIFPYSDLLHSLLPQGEGLLFRGENGAAWDNWTAPHNELIKRAKVPHFTRHDCRRFYSTTHSKLGTAPHIREILLTHALGTEVTRTYDRYTYLEEKRAAQAAYERHLVVHMGPSRK